MALAPDILSPGQRFVPGILGGLGPLAHVHFEREVLRQSHRRGARGDRDHPVWLLASASSTPGRTDALLGGGGSPVRHLTAFARLLEAAGADALFVACNTAHAYHAEVQRAIGIPWVHLMDLVAGTIAAAHPAGTTVGILATDGTLRAGLYYGALERRGLVPCAPAVDSAVQAGVRAAIDDPTTGIKATGAEVASDARAHLDAAARWCVAQGASVVVLGCTEVSVGLGGAEVPGATLVDPLVVAADALLDLASGRRTPDALRSAAV
jgi:aspartate racemase